MFFRLVTGRKKQSLIPMRNQTWGAQILRPKALPLTSTELYGELVFIQVWQTSWHNAKIGNNEGRKIKGKKKAK